MKSFECFQHLEQGKLWEMENSDLGCGYRRILKLTGRTIVVGLRAPLCVEKIDSESYRYKKNQENQARKFLVLFTCHCFVHLS